MRPEDVWKEMKTKYGCNKVDRDQPGSKELMATASGNYIQNDLLRQKKQQKINLTHKEQ